MGENRHQKSRGNFGNTSQSTQDKGYYREKKAQNIVILRKNAGETGEFSQKGPRFFRESVVYWEKRIRKGRITGWNCGNCWRSGRD